MNTVISVENLSKSYQLGSINTGTFYGDLKRWWARQRGRPDPYQKIGEISIVLCCIIVYGRNFDCTGMADKGLFANEGNTG